MLCGYFKYQKVHQCLLVLGLTSVILSISSISLYFAEVAVFFHVVHTTYVIYRVLQTGYEMIMVFICPVTAVGYRRIGYMTA